MAWYESMYEIIIGCGHLWYLPMIFGVLYYYIILKHIVVVHQ